MSDDVKLCVEILEKAIAFEREGIRFFRDKAENAPNEMERMIFRSLAKDEAGHEAHLRKLLDDLLATNQLEGLQPEGHEHQGPREIFESALALVETVSGADDAELEILKGAMDVERRGHTMYAGAADSVISPEAKALFEHLAAEEQNHYLLLNNTYTYLTNPSGWNAFDESPMLDGG
ncbi:MAG: ferritin family protein [bacterium]